MKTPLIACGVLFLLLALVLFIAAIAVFLIARKRRATVAPAAAPPAPVPARSPLVDAPRSQVSPVDDDRTVMSEGRRIQLWGSIVGLTGPIAGRVIPIDPNGFYVGRDQSLSQVLIESSAISKRHLWIGVRDGALMAIDQGSTNGTFLNDPQSPSITEVKLNPGDVLILGEDVARLVYRV